MVIQAHNEQNLTFFVILFLYTDATTDESFEMKIFNHDFRASDSKIHVMLKKANLTGHGYKKEVVTKVVQEAEGGKEFQACHYVYFERSN